MQRCKICQAPLNGILSGVGKLLFKIKPSNQNPEICNKCADKLPQAQTYKCQICQRMIEEKHALMHIKAEEYLINLIKRDHPQWQQKDPTCKECIEYYRKLIKEAEI